LQDADEIEVGDKPRTSCFVCGDMMNIALFMFTCSIRAAPGGVDLLAPWWRLRRTYQEKSARGAKETGELILLAEGQRRYSIGKGTNTESLTPH